MTKKLNTADEKILEILNNQSLITKNQSELAKGIFKNKDTIDIKILGAYK